MKSAFRTRAARIGVAALAASILVIPAARAQVTVPSFSTPEEEGVIDSVVIPDPGPLFLIDPGVVDSIIVGNVGEQAGEWPHIQYLFYVLSVLGDGNCDNGASATAPFKEEAKIKARGSMVCPTNQEEISLKVCIDYRDGGWITLGCKPKVVGNAPSAHKRITVACAPGRFLYRTRVVAHAVDLAGNASYDTATTPSGGRIPCMV